MFIILRGNLKDSMPVCRDALSVILLKYAFLSRGLTVPLNTVGGNPMLLIRGQKKIIFMHADDDIALEPLNI